MLRVEFTRRMKRDAKTMKKRGKDMKKLETVIDLLADEKPLPREYRDHALRVLQLITA